MFWVRMGGFLVDYCGGGYAGAGNENSTVGLVISCVEEKKVDL
jgi:hypothetical protein